MFKSIKSLSFIYLLSICMLCLTGCGKDEALETYKADMETFFSNISEINDNMNSIDVSEDDYIAQIFACAA